MGKKSKAVPVTGPGGPYGCETSRLPHFLDNLLTDGGGVCFLIHIFTTFVLNVLSTDLGN
jgi:hypothetical protein